MKPVTSRNLKIDYMLIISFLVLTGIGILTIFSVSSGEGVRDTQHIRQLY
jgi:cell division protein FtsW (lipid II flippase)